MYDNMHWSYPTKLMNTVALFCFCAQVGWDHAPLPGSHQLKVEAAAFNLNRRAGVLCACWGAGVGVGACGLFLAHVQMRGLVVEGGTACAWSMRGWMEAGNCGRVKHPAPGLMPAAPVVHQK